MTDKLKQGAPLGNTNRQLADTPTDSFLHVRCLKKDKSLWVKASTGQGGLSAWIIKQLNIIASK